MLGLELCFEVVVEFAAAFELGLHFLKRMLLWVHG